MEMDDRSGLDIADQRPVGNQMITQFVYRDFVFGGMLHTVGN
jgi:hypothetical protein